MAEKRTASRTVRPKRIIEQFREQILAGNENDCVAKPSAFMLSVFYNHKANSTELEMIKSYTVIQKLHRNT